MGRRQQKTAAVSGRGAVASSFGGSINEELEKTHAKQVRHFPRNLTILTPLVKPLPMKRRRKEKAKLVMEKRER